MKKDYQIKAFSGGLALGLCIIGKYSLPSAKVPLEFAMARAWRVWAHRSRFPAVDDVFNPGKPTVDPYIAMTTVTERTRTPFVAFFWNHDRPRHEITQREASDLDLDDVEDLTLLAECLTQEPTIPPADWATLAATLLKELDIEPEDPPVAT